MGAVSQAHPPQVAIELAAGDEVGQRMLLDACGALVGKELLLGHGGQQSVGTASQPTRSAGARVLLADPVCTTRSGFEPLEGLHGGTVVAALGVAIVLYGDRVGRAQPPRERRATLGTEHHAGWVLMGRREHDGVDSGLLERLHDDAFRIDGDGNGLASGAACDRRLFGAQRAVSVAGALETRAAHRGASGPAVERWAPSHSCASAD